jgi:hypothetical protein
MNDGKVAIPLLKGMKERLLTLSIDYGTMMQDAIILYPHL